ncbi:hypothetical protein HGA92_02755 [Candidatus Gracilibacteria bacterium]|nr:hypothetical protein [Candidatus Gracilibacteria bacterium]NUJ98337.1 hypothetical protein [Candidatus Gracilibacteria bacterium]NUJ99308.1 hypothetical protein [Candidatus Gracilibacteria bacterium]
MKTKTRKFIASLLLFFSFGDISHVIALDYVIDFSVPTDYTSSSSTQAYVNNSLAQLSEQLNHKGKINSTTTYSGAYDVVVDGNYAYMTNYLRDSVSILNISNPANPTFVSEIVNNAGTIRLDGASGIVKDGNYLYVASNVSDAIQIIDVTNPATPTPTGQLINSTTLNGARGIAKSGNYIYLTCDTYDALQVINVSNPASPTIAGTVRNTTTLNGARDIKIVGTYAYITAYDGDYFTVINISNPLAPTVSGSVTDATNLNGAHHVEVSGNYAYVSAYLNASVRVIDISTPTAPVGVINISGGSYSLTNPRDLLIDGDKLFISSYGNDAINIADISVPTTPVFVNKIIHNAANPLLDGVDGLFKVGNFIYVASYLSSALEILEVSYPKTIQFQQLNHKGKINSTTTYSGAYDVIVDGNYAYMTNYLRDSVSILNISNPANPTFVSEIVNNAGTIRLDGASGIVKDGNYLYVASNVSDAIQIIDVTNPATPTPTGQLINSTTLNGARGIAKSGNYIYLTCDTYDALQVINVSNPASPTIAGTVRNTTTLNGARDIKIVGTYAYITAYDGDYFTVINISNPLAPTVSGSVTDATNLNGAHHVEVSGNYAYVSAYLNASVRVIDISTPTAPVGVINISGGSYSLTNPRDLLIDGDKLFISSYGNDAINIADISVPTTPVFVNKIIHNAANPLLDGVDGLFKVGNFIYVASYLSSALEILEASSLYPTVPYITTNTNTTYLGALYNMIEKVGVNNAGNMKYQISKNGGVNYYYWNGNAWIIGNAGDYSQTNDIATIQANILSFNNVISGNSFRLRAYLESDGTEKSELDDVTISSDNTAPIISSSSPSSDGILPKGDFTLSFNYSDNESGVDTNSSTISLQKWNGVGAWGGDIAPSYIDQLGISITSSQANYPMHTLGYGKYRANFSIKDIVGNTRNREIIFYVDEITWNISRPDIAINEAKAFTHSFSDDEITLTIQTVGAGFSLYLKNNTPPTNGTGNMIEDWDGTKGFGYDFAPYTGSVQKINNSNIVLVSQNKNLNTNGEKNTYTYKIKLGAYTNYSHSSGNYNGELGFIFSSEYQ